MKEADEYCALEDCARNIFGRVRWSHKIQEKQADTYRCALHTMSIVSIVLSTIVSVGLISLLFTDKYILKLVSALVSCVSTILVAIIKEYDFGKMIQSHRESAVKYLAVKDQLLLLIYRIRRKEEDCSLLEKELEVLVKKVNRINSSAPQTSDSAVRKASKALKEKMDDTISDMEIDNGLPWSLRKTR